MSDVVLILELDEYERDLLVCALQRWRREIAPEYKPAGNDGIRFACVYTTDRIDEMLGRLEGER